MGSEMCIRDSHREVLTHLHHIARTDGLQGGAVADTGLVHLAGEHREGQPRPVDHRNVEVLEVVGDATDVVFMTMGDDHAADPLLVLAQEAGVGQHHIHSVLNVIAKARELGYMRAPDELFVPIKQINDVPDRETLLLMTGSQGEPCLLYTSPSPRDGLLSRMPSSA